MASQGQLLPVVFRMVLHTVLAALLVSNVGVCHVLHVADRVVLFEHLR